MKNQISKIDAPELKALDQSKAEKIKQTFEPMAEMLKGFENDYNSLIKESKNGITEELTVKAKRLRLDIGKVRIETGKLKDKQKEYIKLEDRAIMGVHNILVWAVKEKEDKLKEIEKFFEIQEQKRLQALQLERVKKISDYIEDANERDFTKFADDEFEALLSMKKKEQEDRIAAEKKAEEDRIAKEKAEAEERERIRKENERLRKEAEKREKEDRERKAREEEEKKAREEEEKKAREEYEAKLKAEREEKEKIQRELELKAEAEKKAREEEEARIENELKKGDIEKVNDLISDLSSLKTKYTFKSANNKKMYADVSLLIDKVIEHIKK